MRKADIDSRINELPRFLYKKNEVSHECTEEGITTKQVLPSSMEFTYNSTGEVYVKLSDLAYAFRTEKSGPTKILPGVRIVNVPIK